MPVIRITPQVEKFLRSKGHFGDTHDSVLRRLLGIGPKPGQQPQQQQNRPQGARPGAATPPLRFRRLMLRILLNSPGHKVPVGQLLPRVLQNMKSQFTPRDRSKVAGKKLLWVANAEKGRNGLTKDGLIRRSRQGNRPVWELTPRGTKRAQQIRATGGR